jgi:hypothetical protein
MIEGLWLRRMNRPSLAGSAPDISKLEITPELRTPGMSCPLPHGSDRPVAHLTGLSPDLGERISAT